MSTNTMEYLGDLSGCVYEGTVPDVSEYAEIGQDGESLVDWADRCVEVRTKNLGIAAFLEGVELPKPHNRHKNIDRSNPICSGACDGHIEAQADEAIMSQPTQMYPKTQIIGQLALF